MPPVAPGDAVREIYAMQQAGSRRDPGESMWAVVRDLIASAPPRARRALWFNLACADFAIVIAAVDFFMGSEGLEPYRLAGIVIGIIGLSLLGVAYVLHHTSQQTSADCAPMSFFELRSEVMHRIFVALPVMALLAAILLATAIGLFVPSVIDKPFLLIVVALFVTYLGLAIRTVVHTSRFLYEYAQRQAAVAAQAQADVAEAQLATLQAQMNPHFLFNALNTVASLVRIDGKAAERTVENLSDVLRRTLDRSRKTVSTVREEIEFLKAYLAVEQQRWGSRLRVDWAVEPDTLSLPLPPMTLQPLVENALKHGIGNRLEGGRVRISATQSDGKLRLTVTDDGVGFGPRYRERTGLGNLRSRLATLYGDESVLEVERNGNGATVIVEIPVTGSGG